LTTALLAGVSLAAAQNAPNNRQPEGAGRSQQAPEHPAPREGTTGQSTQREHEGQNQRQGQTQERENERQGQAQPGQRQQGKSEGRENQRQGQDQQGQRQQGNAQNQGQERENQRQGEAQQGQRQQGSAQNQGLERENQRQGQAQQGQGERATVNLTPEQRTKLRQDVLSGSNVPRVENVNFALRTGTIVPNDVRIIEVPETLITIHPEWRGDEYFVVRDDVVIVDRDHRIVAVRPVGSASAQREGGSLSLGQNEIREVQMKLNQKGFNVGEPDGVMGPKTKNGLAQFQRQQGLQESGDVDSETADALGVSSGRSTTGSAPRNR
jgi:hypothetical protein